MFIFLLLQDANSQFILLLVILFWSTLAISILPVCCKKSKKSSKTNKLANGNSAKASSDSKMNKRKKKSGKKEDKPKKENDKQKQTFSQVQKLKTTSKSTAGTCVPDNKTTTGEKKKVEEDEDKSKEKKERKNSELKTAKSFKTCSKSELSMPSEDMMSKHEEIVEIVDVNFIISSKNLKPPKGQTSLSVFNQIRKNAAQHLMEDMSSLHAYDQVPLIDQMRMPKKGKGPKNELKNNLYFSS
ncbi:unnamed protein product [Meloidogyne enterolobii]|uniref:Uncharacterized protein n=1 Tax=Meloidogyne enterolobii TaxID=390850 RepID=A0ACB1AL92_MELEN